MYYMHTTISVVMLTYADACGRMLTSDACMNTSLDAHAVTSEYAIARRTACVHAAATVATAGNTITGVSITPAASGHKAAPSIRI